MGPALAALIPVVGNLLDRIFPDPAAAAEAKVKVMEMAQRGDLAQLEADVKLATGQMEINKVEAASSDPFTSRARPFIMWVCGFALLYASILEPMIRFVAMVGFKYSGAFPSIDSEITLQLLFALLGLGAYRSIEKVKGVAK